MPNRTLRSPARPNLRTMLELSAKEHRGAIALSVRSGNHYVNYTYKTLKDNAAALGAALRALGHESENIIIAGENGYTWCTAYLAVTCYCGTSLPLSRSLAPETFVEIAGRTGAKLALLGAGCESIAEKLTEAGVRVVPFSSVKKLILQGKKETFPERTVSADTVAELAVSSVADGSLKLAELTHANVCFTLEQLAKMLPTDDSDVFYSVLPLTHCYERICGFLYPLSRGASIAYGEGLHHLTGNLQLVRPTVILCVPFVLDKIYSKIWQNIERKGIGERVRRAIKLSNATGPLRMTLRRQIFAEIHDTLGGRLSLLICGGSTADPDTIAGLHDFGIRALQGYGMTESASLISVNRRDLHEYSSVGLQTPDGLIDIYNVQSDGVGEIRYRGGNVMKGYFDDPNLTAETVSGGWLYTGDMGYFDRRGFLHIVGRKNNMIVTGRGKQVFPEELESELKRSPFVKNALVIGIPNKTNDDYDIVAVICPDIGNLTEIYGEYLSDDQINAEIGYAVKKANRDRDSARRIKKFIIRREELPLSEDGKILRNEVTAETLRIAKRSTFTTVKKED